MYIRALFAVSIVVVLATVWWSSYQDRQLHRVIVGTADLQEKIREFDANPNIRLCIYLIDRLHTERRYIEAIEYGNRCINSVKSDSSEGGWFIRVWMAALSNKVGDSVRAEEHLRVALTLDKEGRIRRHGFIDGLGLQTVYDRIVEQGTGNVGPSK